MKKKEIQFYGWNPIMTILKKQMVDCGVII